MVIFALKNSHLHTCTLYMCYNMSTYVHVNAYILYVCTQRVRNCGVEHLIVVFPLQLLREKVTYIVVNVANSVLGVVWVATSASLDDVGWITEYIVIQCCRKRVKNNLVIPKYSITTRRMQSICGQAQRAEEARPTTWTFACCAGTHVH